MDNKGFTLVEILAVIALLALVVIITVPAISSVSDNIKKSTLKTKIENIEKAAVLYGQEHRENFTDSTCTYCSGISDCNCYEEKDNSGNVVTINVEKLINSKVLEADDEFGNISNPTNDSLYLNDCEIQIYQKYGKIYADYLKDTDDDINTDCWYQS